MRVIRESCTHSHFEVIKHQERIKTSQTLCTCKHHGGEDPERFFSIFNRVKKDLWETRWPMLRRTTAPSPSGVSMARIERLRVRLLLAGKALRWWIRGEGGDMFGFKQMCFWRLVIDEKEDEERWGSGKEMQVKKNRASRKLVIKQYRVHYLTIGQRSSKQKTDHTTLQYVPQS